MPENFKFQDDDTTVRTYLNTAERAKVGTWQSSSDFTFEFHEGHGTGYPIYIRPDGNTDKSNLPKFDTLNKTAASYRPKDAKQVSLAALANGNKLLKLSSKTQADIVAVIDGSWVSLALLASRRWTQTKAPADPLAAPTDRACTATANCTGRVPIVAGKSSKQMCPVCFKYQ
jgi:hypothetical protein